MSLSKSKCWYSNNCLHFLKRAVPLLASAWCGQTGCITLWYYSTYDRIQFTSLDTRISLCIHTPFGAKNTSSRSHFEDDSSPHISRNGSLIRIKPTFVLFKHVTLMWINYLETWSHWDNTSCYYRWTEKGLNWQKMNKKSIILARGRPSADVRTIFFGARLQSGKEQFPRKTGRQRDGSSLRTQTVTKKGKKIVRLPFTVVINPVAW